MRRFFLVLVFFIPTVLCAGSNVWVAVRVQDRPDGISEYHGSMESKVFWEFVQNKKSEGVFRLYQAFAIDVKGNPTPLPQLEISNKKLGYGADVFLRLEHVYRLIPLDEAFVKRHVR